LNEGTGIHVLLVDDDPSLARVLQAGFEARGYDVHVAPNGREGLLEADATDPQVVILDLGLPDLDGLEVCRHLRARTRTPVIVLSADGAEDRKVAALDLGADDYLTKPFSMPELLARVRVALRHRQSSAALLDEDVTRVGGVVIDQAAHQVFVGDHPIDLSRKEHALLVLLARNPGKLLTHRRLLELVWGGAQGLDTLRTHVSTLRRKLGAVPGAGVSIVSDPGVGYRLLIDGDPDGDPDDDRG
jgi:two-component system KDP operon response regulator KdpE